MIEGRERTGLADEAPARLGIRREVRLSARPMADFVPLCATADVAPGTGKTITAAGKELAVFNVGGTFHALDNECPHRGGPLGEGDLEGCLVTCPWHGWQYDVTTGCNTMDESERVDRYEVKVEGDAVLVAV